jgi:hypothetical protein
MAAAAEAKRKPLVKMSLRVSKAPARPTKSARYDHGEMRQGACPHAAARTWGTATACGYKLANDGVDTRTLQVPSLASVPARSTMRAKPAHCPAQSHVEVAQPDAGIVLILSLAWLCWRVLDAAVQHHPIERQVFGVALHPKLPRGKRGGRGRKPTVPARVALPKSDPGPITARFPMILIMPRWRR